MYRIYKERTFWEGWEINDIKREREILRVTDELLTLEELSEFYDDKYNNLAIYKEVADEDGIEEKDIMFIEMEFLNNFKK